MRFLASPSTSNSIVSRLQPYGGGTGAATVPDAVTALGALSSSKVNAVNGVAGLNSAGIVNSSIIPSGFGAATVTVTGPLEVLPNSLNVYKITNYDINTVYTLSVINAGSSIVQNGDTLVYKAGPTVGMFGFRINDKELLVNTLVQKPNVPVLTGVDSGGSPATLTFNSSVYSNTLGSNTHLNSDWQIATDVNFTNIVTSSISDYGNKTSLIATTMSLSTTYYTRVRYRDNASVVSDWSNVVTITTKASYLVGVIEEAKLTAFDGTNGDVFGYSVSISGDGSRVIIGAYYNECAYVFKRTGTTWALENKLSPSVVTGDTFFGNAVAINTAGNRAVIGAYNSAEGGTVGAGAAYIFSRTGTAWTQEAKLIAPTSNINSNFGWSVDLDLADSRVIVGARNYNTNYPLGTERSGAAFIFSKISTTWTQEFMLASTDAFTNANDVFGFSVSMNGDGSRVVIGAVSDNANVIEPTSGLPYQRSLGAAYVYMRAGTTWIEEAKLTPVNRTVDALFGYSVAINSDGSRIIVGESRGDNTADIDQGAAYIFLRTGVAWAQEAKLLNATVDAAATNFFGWSVDINGDGSIVLIGGINNNSSLATRAGGAFIFKRTGSTWSAETRIFASDSANGDSFGRSVSLSNIGDLAVIGSPYANNGTLVDTGAAYIYR